MKTIATDKAPAAIGPYSQAVVQNGMLYTSGQIPLDPLTGEVSGENMMEQTQRVMLNLAAVLEGAGTTFDRVVKTTCYLQNMEDFGVFNEIYAKYFISRPARACVEVAALPKGVLVEVELIAALP